MSESIADKETVKQLRLRVNLLIDSVYDFIDDEVALENDVYDILQDISSLSFRAGQKTALDTIKEESNA